MVYYEAETSPEEAMATSWRDTCHSRSPYFYTRQLGSDRVAEIALPAPSLATELSNLVRIENICRRMLKVLHDAAFQNGHGIDQELYISVEDEVKAIGALWLLP